MLEYTRQGGGSRVTHAERSSEVTILDVFRHMASVKVISPEMCDYLHLVKWNDPWRHINVFWEVREGELRADQ
jgi:hypothetical protein